MGTMPFTSTSRPQIALFSHHPECSDQCCEGIERALGDHYDIRRFNEKTLDADLLASAAIVAFPGGIGDADSYYDFFLRKKANMVADYVAQGGRYLGICMGAYWAGHWFFDILEDAKCEQYIKRPGADVRKSYGTVTEVSWQGEKHNMFFWDGCALIGDESKFDVIARYQNGDPMAIQQGRIGLIGCHPESTEMWFEKPRQYISQHWHRGRHHELLLRFVDDLMKK
jgi:glutamine amidotransferase-like uncharacterized protein